MSIAEIYERLDAVNTDPSKPWFDDPDFVQVGPFLVVTHFIMNEENGPRVVIPRYAEEITIPGSRLFTLARFFTEMGVIRREWEESTVRYKRP